MNAQNSTNSTNSTNSINPALETKPVIQKTVYLVRPASLDITKMSGLSAKDQQKTLWFISHLSTLHHRFKNRKWIELYAKTTLRMLGKFYKRSLMRAEEFGYIESKGTYLVGFKCKYYKLVDPLLREAIAGEFKYEKCTDTILAANIIKGRVRKYQNDSLKIASSDLDLWLQASLNDVAFQKNINSDLLDRLDGPIGLNDIKYNEAFQSLVDKLPYYKVCNQGRRHTPFTVLPSIVRDSVLFESKPESKVVEIDIRNSQPVFLVAELLEMVMAGETIEDSVHNASARVESKLSPSMKSFITDVEDGELYNVLMKDLKITDRGYFKTEFFKNVLYGRVHENTKNNKIVKAFVARYPDVWKLICLAKVDSHADLACRMQKRESNFVFERVLPRLMKQHPTARVLTVHDAIYCEEWVKHDLIAIMNEEFVKIGVRGNLRVDVLKR